MGKQVVLTIMTALLGASFAFHSSAGHYAAAVPKSGVATSKALPASGGDGPWIASCNYWRPLRRLPVDLPQSAQSSILSKRVKQDQSPDCSSKQWGVPPTFAVAGGEAHAVIATVPDPVHSHLAPEFDRILDVLMGAAADNGYLLRYSWLPWKPSSTKATKTTDPQQDAEPGLLVFDHRSTSADPRSRTSFLYMFLVAEMPADGVNSEQLKRALRYELQLRSSLRSTFATDDRDNLRVIGPQYSGSAMSLDQTITTVLADDLINTKPKPIKTRLILGTTSTEPARKILNQCGVAPDEICDPNPDPSKNPNGVYYGTFASGQGDKALKAMVEANDDIRDQTVLLAEDGTSYSAYVKNGAQVNTIKDKGATELGLPFPREISLLRNSYQDGNPGTSAPITTTPSPYLHMSTRDDESQDTLPDFSTRVTPLSQEAQLMAISHTVTQLHAKSAYIVASNPLDAVFLAKSLHRSNPDTRLILEPDLLLQREGDDTPYIGSLGITPYPLVWLARPTTSHAPLRSFASSEMEAYYNAASFTLADVMKTAIPADALYGYNTHFERSDPSTKLGCPRLWLTVVGSDGYYPVALLNASSQIMQVPPSTVPADLQTIVYPSGAWQALCVLVSLACLLHIAALWSASFISPLTCDLDLIQSCATHRRALYGQIGGATLFLMSAAVSLPVVGFLGLRTGFAIDKGDEVLALVTAALGVAGWLIAIHKTFASRRIASERYPKLFGMTEKQLCSFLYAGGAGVTLLLAGMWLTLCLRSVDDQRLGLFFSYRCLHPLNGVAPLTPALLLLWGWLFWAVMHTRRLRLTTHSRPRLPDADKIESWLYAGLRPNLSNLFVSDTRLEAGTLEDTTCLMISRRLLQRTLRAREPGFFLLFCAAVLTFAWVIICPIHTLDHFGSKIGSTTLYEAFIGLLLVPLLVLALCAATRLFLISASLRGELLEPLERMPFRHAFTRLRGFSWVGMLREGGQLERWRDMARSTEAIRQIVNHPDMPQSLRTENLRKQYLELEAKIDGLRQHIKALREDRAVPDAEQSACKRLDKIEEAYANCAEEILCGTLLPRWLSQSSSFIESAAKTNALDTPKKPSHLVLLAEEFLALRYVAFIRAILAQMRYLLIFITAALVLVILAINCYPFQPRQELNWCVTVVFFSFCAGIVMVLGQMHRNTMLSRITNKAAHGLGLDFYLRVGAFAALPLLTWLATQYPGIGGTLYGIIKPGLDAVR